MGGAAVLADASRKYEYNDNDSYNRTADSALKDSYILT
jgi:hypothetical protein